MAEEPPRVQAILSSVPISAIEAARSVSTFLDRYGTYLQPSLHSLASETAAAVDESKDINIGLKHKAGYGPPPDAYDNLRRFVESVLGSQQSVGGAGGGGGDEDGEEGPTEAAEPLSSAAAITTPAPVQEEATELPSSSLMSAAAREGTSTPQAKLASEKKAQKQVEKEQRKQAKREEKEARKSAKKEAKRGRKEREKAEKRAAKEREKAERRKRKAEEREERRRAKRARKGATPVKEEA